MERWRQAGREVAVVGLGRSGVSATRLLLARGIPVYASDRDRTPDLEASAARLRGAGATVELGRHDPERIVRSAGVVLSPGVPPDVSLVQQARQAGLEVRAEIDLGLEALAGVPYLGVTGTNGKSTTTALAAHLLGADGRLATACGNIGLPLCEVALRDLRPDWLAIEFSSFQLHDCPRVNPRAGILTNLSPDHLDRYPTLEAYYQDKALFFRQAHRDSAWVVNGDDPESGRMVSGVNGRVLRFSTRAPAEGWLDSRAGRLMLGDEPLIRRDELRLLGEHNVANALAAALATRAVDVPLEAVREGLRSFSGLPHRLETVRERDGVLWINDSKATNLASTEVGLTALDRPCVLLLGGRHKGEPYTRLAPRLSRCRAVVAYGEAAPLVAADLGGVVRVMLAATFEEVLEVAAGLARPGDAVLLSPACSSFDMFANYEDRGARFRALVEAM
jgi:UDP-N-acetylmuramoylalanine--D-glutamate ligase